MKATVKLGKAFLRIDVGDCDRDTAYRIQKHVQRCPKCQEMLKVRKVNGVGV